MTIAAAAAARGWLAGWRQRAFRHAPSDAAEVTLRHSRIYILPTRRGLALVATLAIMVVTSLNYALALGFVVAFLLAGLAAAALLHAFRNLAGVTLRPGPVGETFAGGTLPFALHVLGNGRERVALVLEARDATATAIDVAADGAVLATLAVPAPARGLVPLGRVSVASDFPLGLWRGWAYVHFPVTGVAYPAPEPGAPPLPVPAGDGDDAGAGRQDDGDLAGLRDYVRGDPLQRVAWKSVARGRGWYTKDFDPAGRGGEVVLDFGALPATLGTEARLGRLAAWVLACERAARPCALRLPAASVPTGVGREHRRAMLVALARHEAT